MILEQTIVFTHAKDKKIKIKDFLLLNGDQRDHFLFNGVTIDFIEQVKISMEIKIFQNNINRYIASKNNELLLAYIKSTKFVNFENEDFEKNFHLQESS